MGELLARLREHVDRRTLLFVTKINVYGFGLLIFWTAVNILLLPVRVDETVRDALQGSALGLISFLGVGFAVLVQPLAGRVSDAWPGADKRRPFIILGTVLVVPGLFFFTVARGVAVLLLGFVLMQLATNISQAAFQAFIPDVVKEEQRGIASGAKNILSVLGAAVGLAGAQGLFALGAGTGGVVVFIGVVIVLTGILTVRWVPCIPGDSDRGWREALRRALSLRRVWHEVSDTLGEHRTFRLAVLAQFLFMLGTYPAQRFLLLFLRDRFGEDAVTLAAIGGVGAIVLAVVAAGAAGALSDVMGRKPVLIGGAVIGAAGMALIGFAPTPLLVAIAGGMIAVSYGAFLAVIWALLNDDLPEGRAAGALGIANIAVAGAGALAGLYGPVVDLMHATFPAATYQVTFGLAGIVAALSLLPLRRIGESSE